MAGRLSTFRIFPRETSLVLNMMIQYVWYSVSLFKKIHLLYKLKIKADNLCHETKKKSVTHNGKHYFKKVFLRNIYLLYVLIVICLYTWFTFYIIWKAYISPFLILLSKICYCVEKQLVSIANSDNLTIYNTKHPLKVEQNII